MGKNSAERTYAKFSVRLMKMDIELSCFRQQTICENTTF